MNWPDRYFDKVAARFLYMIQRSVADRLEETFNVSSNKTLVPI